MKGLETHVKLSESKNIKDVTGWINHHLKSGKRVAIPANKSAVWVFNNSLPDGRIVGSYMTEYELTTETIEQIELKMKMNEHLYTQVELVKSGHYVTIYYYTDIIGRVIM